MLRLIKNALLSQPVLLGNAYHGHAMGAASVIPARELNDTFCPAHTKQFTGSVSLDHGKELFYWLFESESDPANDPLIVWLSGGPGAASTFAAVSEIGPCIVEADGNSTRHNPHHWAKNANLLVLDQPAGVGFSKPSPESDHEVTNLEQATEDFVDFMHGFTTKAFPRLSNNTVHIAAESYGGRWGPAFMNRLYGLGLDKSPRSIPNPLGSVILVNAVIGTLGGHLSTASYEFGCTPDSVAVKLGFGFNETVCDRIQQMAPSCELYAQSCEATNDLSICAGASGYCANIKQMIEFGNRSHYNVARPCNHPEDLCIDEVRTSRTWFGKRSVKEALGLPNTNWIGVNYEMEEAFVKSGAITQSVVPAVTNLLNSGSIRMLVMNGDLDALVTTAGQVRIFDELRWRYQVDYRQQKWQDWVVKSEQGVSSGRVKSSHGLTFVTFADGGHMVPGDDPAGASAVLSQWLSEQ